jgi:hypothetical protein
MAALGGLPPPEPAAGRAVVLFVKLDADELAAQLLTWKSAPSRTWDADSVVFRITGWSAGFIGFRYA